MPFRMAIKSKFPDRLQVRLTSSLELIRASLEPYTPWIEEMMGAPLDQTLTLEVDADPGDAVAEDLLQGLPLSAGTKTRNRSWHSLIEEWTLPGGGSPVLLPAEMKSKPPSYDLRVSIEPETGSIAVQGSIEVSLENSAASNFKFNLHETLAIKKLLVNGKEATFVYVPMESQLPLPASRGVVVNVPPGLSQRRVRMDIEYGGRMKVLPEFGASPDWHHSLDDQINSRMVELAGYSSWYPQFVFGQPLQLELALSLPQTWTSICSGKKLADHVQEGRALTRWSSPKDMDILILASPNYKEKSFHESGVNLEIYYTQMPEHFIGQEGAQIVSVLKLYSARLGGTNIPGGTVKHVYSPPSGRVRVRRELPGQD